MLQFFRMHISQRIVVVAEPRRFRSLDFANEREAMMLRDRSSPPPQSHARRRRHRSPAHDDVFAKGQVQRTARPLRRDESYAHMMMSADEPPSPVES